MEIVPAYSHSKFGNWMFYLCAKWTKFIVKHKWLFYLLSCSWGLIMTLFGVLCTWVLAVAKLFDPTIEFNTFYWIYYIKAGPKCWGGFETGLMFVRDHTSSDSYINDHEFGHTISQMSWLGPFSILLVNIPSAVRYWAMELFPNKQWKPYDSFWAEDAATQCGKYAVEYLKNKTV